MTLTKIALKELSSSHSRKEAEPPINVTSTFEVRSQSGNGRYVITNGKGWDCTCPDHVYRKVMCKHIFAVKFWLALKERIDKSDVFQLYREFVEPTVCRFCGFIYLHPTEGNKVQF